MKIIGPLTLVLLFIYLASERWKLAIKSILVLVIIEGALRRWALPEARDLIYFIKDLVLIGAYIGFYSRPLPLKDRYPLLKELSLVITAFCCLQAFNPNLGSPIIGLLGIRAYLLYIPLVWVVPHLFNTESDLRNFLRKYLLVLIPVCILGIIQYFSPANSFLNVYVEGGELDVATIGNTARITGTFAYIAGMGVYLQVCFSLLIIMISQENKLRWKLFFIFELALVVVNSFMTGSRAVIGYEIIFILGYLVFLFSSNLNATLKFAGQMFFPTLIAAYLAVTYFQPSIEAFTNRAFNSDSTEDRISDSFTQVFDYAEGRIEGYGIGATQGGTKSLRKLLNLPDGEVLPPSEGETGRVVIELGVIGFILWYGLRLLLLFSLYSIFTKLKNPFYKQLALSIILFQGINITGQLVTNPTMLVYFWFFSGFIYLLPKLESQEEQQNIFTNTSNNIRLKQNNFDK